MRWIRRLGGFGLGVFALSSVWQTAPGHIGLALCLPSALVAVWERRGGRPDTATVLALALALWLLARYALQAVFAVGDPAMIKAGRVFIDWFVVLLFALLAALPCADPLQRLRRLWLLSMLGFALGIVGFLWQAGAAALWSGERIGFHLDRPLGVGLYAGCFAIALLAGWRQWCFVAGPLRWPARLAGGLATLLFAQVLMSTQNRSTYLGAIIVICGAVLATALRAARGQAPRRAARTAAMLAAAGVLCAGIVALNLDVISARLQAESEVATDIASGGLSQAPTTSITIRLRLWQYALERFPDAPLLGHGFGDVGEAIRRDLLPHMPADPDYAPEDAYPQDHLHSSYLQLLWSQGLIGFALWGALSIVLVRDALRAARRDAACRALMPAMWAILAFVAIWAITDYRLSHPDMRFFTILLLLSLRLIGLRGGGRRPDAPDAHP